MHGVFPSLVFRSQTPKTCEGCSLVWSSASSILHDIRAVFERGDIPEKNVVLKVETMFMLIVIMSLNIQTMSKRSVTTLTILFIYLTQTPLIGSCFSLLSPLFSLSPKIFYVTTKKKHQSDGSREFSIFRFALKMAEYLASIFGTEKDKVNCSFFFKTGTKKRCI